MFTKDAVAEAAELREKLAKAEAKIAQFNALTEDQRLATLIHEKQCHWNHTDGCGWFYADEKDPTIWVREFSRKEYIKKAQNILAATDYDTALKVLEAL